MTTRAKKGGELGANGEWYEGGKFLNTIPENRKREGSQPKGSGKSEIEPFVWSVGPDGMVSIYRQLAGVFGKVVNGVMVVSTSQQTLNYFGRTIEEVDSLAARWNAGERWLSVGAKW